MRFRVTSRSAQPSFLRRVPGTVGGIHLTVGGALDAITGRRADSSRMQWVCRPRTAGKIAVLGLGTMGQAISEVCWVGILLAGGDRPIVEASWPTWWITELGTKDARLADEFVDATSTSLWIGPVFVICTKRPPTPASGRRRRLRRPGCPAQSPDGRLQHPNLIRDFAPAMPPIMVIMSSYGKIPTGVSSRAAGPPTGAPGTAG